MVVKLRQQLRKGSTPVLIMSIIDKEPMYGYQIMRELERRSEGYFQLTAASLYPTLHRMEEEGLVRSSWQEGQGERRRKYYVMTDKGRRVLHQHSVEWHRFYRELAAVLDPNLPASERHLR